MRTLFASTCLLGGILLLSVPSARAESITGAELSLILQDLSRPGSQVRALQTLASKELPYQATRDAIDRERHAMRLRSGEAQRLGKPFHEEFPPAYDDVLMRVVSLLKSPSVEVRETTVATLGKTGLMAGYVGMISNIAVSHRDPQVRMSAIHALSEITEFKGERYLGLARILKSETVYEVRVEAVEAYNILMIPSPACRPDLLKPST